MIQLHLLYQWVIILKTPGLLIAGNVLKQKVSCVTMILTNLRSWQLAHPTELMVFAANLVSPESTAPAMESTLALNHPLVALTASELWLQNKEERIIKCSLSAQVQVINKHVESVMTRANSTWLWPPRKISKWSNLLVTGLSLTTAATLRLDNTILVITWLLLTLLPIQSTNI